MALEWTRRTRARSEASWHGTAVAAGRIGMGLAGLLAPAVTQRLALLDGDATPEVRVWTRFWATRALALGIGYLAADAPTRRHLVRMGLLVDAADTAFLLAMGARGGLVARPMVWLAGLTASAAAADAAEIRLGGR